MAVVRTPACPHCLRSFASVRDLDAHLRDDGDAPGGQRCPVLRRRNHQSTRHLAAAGDGCACPLPVPHGSSGQATTTNKGAAL